MESLTIRAFRAIDEPETCEKFLVGHRRVLEEFGITNVSTNNSDWCLDPETFVIIASLSNGDLIGGIRLEVSTKERPLPMEVALRHLDGRITQQLGTYAKHGVAEVCGLWNSSQFNSRGLPLLLSFAAVSLANQIQVRSMTCLVAHYTLRHAMRVGFTVMDNIGDGGTFTYPIPSIKAIAMVIPDALSMSSANETSRQNLISLRVRPDQDRIESPAGIDLHVNYGLLVDKAVIALVPYQQIVQNRLRHTA